jgi:hypothetical protein
MKEMSKKWPSMAAGDMELEEDVAMLRQIDIILAFLYLRKTL